MEKKISESFRDCKIRSNGIGKHILRRGLKPLVSKSRQFAIFHLQSSHFLLPFNRTHTGRKRLKFWIQGRKTPSSRIKIQEDVAQKQKSVVLLPVIQSRLIPSEFHTSSTMLVVIFYFYFPERTEQLCSTRRVQEHKCIGATADVPVQRLRQESDGHRSN